MPLYPRRRKLSAKWRRIRRDSKRFNLFKIFNKINKTKNKSVLPTFQATNFRSKRGIQFYRRCGTQNLDLGRKMKELEPLVDVLDEKNEAIVVVELTGFDSKSLKIHVEDQRLTLSAEARDRKYYKSLNLPKRVIPSTMRTTYKNGVLEIRLKKAAEEKAIGEVAG